MIAESPVAVVAADRLLTGKLRHKVLMKPGQRTGSEGGLYEQVDSLGGKTSEYVLVSVPGNTTLPPTEKPGYLWMWVCVVDSRHFRRTRASRSVGPVQPVCA